jgi:hypothetical protein
MLTSLNAGTAHNAAIGIYLGDISAVIGDNNAVCISARAGSDTNITADTSFFIGNN